jgi:hypothetical protein
VAAHLGVLAATAAQVTEQLLVVEQVLATGSHKAVLGIITAVTVFVCRGVSIFLLI